MRRNQTTVPVFISEFFDRIPRGLVGDFAREPTAKQAQFAETVLRYEMGVINDGTNILPARWTLKAC